MNTYHNRTVKLIELEVQSHLELNNSKNEIVSLIANDCFKYASANLFKKQKELPNFYYEDLKLVFIAMLIKEYTWCLSQNICTDSFVSYIAKLKDLETSILKSKGVLV